MNGTAPVCCYVAPAAGHNIIPEHPTNGLLPLFYLQAGAFYYPAAGVIENY